MPAALPTSSFDPPPSPGGSGRWSPFLRGSAALHALAFAAPLAWPQALPWSVAAVALNHLAISGAGLWPRSCLLGPNITRLPRACAKRGEVALTLDDGPDPELTPRVLDLLDEGRHRATFFVIAQRALQHPALVREIVARGHSVQNHSFHHRHNFSLLGPRGFARELALAQQALTALTGETPRFFRAPAGLRNPFLQPVLARQGLRLTSWTRRGFDTRDQDPARVVARLTDGLRGGDILLLHDHHGAHTPAGKPVLLQALPSLLEALHRAGLYSVTLPQAWPATAPVAALATGSAAPPSRPA